MLIFFQLVLFEYVFDLDLRTYEFDDTSCQVNCRPVT